MAELADAQASKPCGLTTREGSSPSPATFSRRRGNPFWSPEGWKPGKVKAHTLQGLDSLPETPDMMPEQFFGIPEDHRFQGEKGLMFATLEQAIKDFQTFFFATGKKGILLFEETQQWFLSTDASWPHSFSNICRELNINPERILNALRKWRDANLTKPVSPFVRRKCHSKGKRTHGGQHAPSGNSPCHT